MNTPGYADSAGSVFKGRLPWDVVWVAVLIYVAATGCKADVSSVETRRVVLDPLRPVATDLGEPADNRLFTLESRNGKVSTTISDPPALRHGSYKPITWKPEVDAASMVPASTIDRLLENDVARAEATGTTDRIVRVAITFRETLALPRVPNLRPEPRDSAANQAVLQRRQAIVDRIREARVLEHDPHVSELVTRHGARVLKTFWLFNGMTVELPLSEVRAVASRSDVQYIETLDEHPPLPSNQSSDARNVMNSDPLFGNAGGYVGLIDSGVRSSHTLLVDHMDIVGDCVNGYWCFWGGNPEDTCNHGTSSASELTANNNLGDANRGITQNTVDSWKTTNEYCGTVAAAVLDAYEFAIGFGDGLLVTEVQYPSQPNGAIAAAADGAFDNGIPTVAAAGNFGMNGADTIRAPANARKALAVGAADVTSQALEALSSRGPTSDWRTKPDILGPTNVYAAGSDSDTALRLHDGTSAANPNAAGLATEIWNYLSRPSEPGLIYAAMIAIGNNWYTGSFDNDTGAGLVQWRDNSSLSVNSFSMTPGFYIDVTFDVNSPVEAIDVAIWWPESIGAHNDLDVYLINPSNQFVASSATASSIFEKARASWGLETGTWTLRVVPYNMDTGLQEVYWALRTIYQ